MRKLYILFLVVFSISCNKDDQEIIPGQLDCENGQAICGYWEHYQDLHTEDDGSGNCIVQTWTTISNPDVFHFKTDSTVDIYFAGSTEPVEQYYSWGYASTLMGESWIKMFHNAPLPEKPIWEIHPVGGPCPMTSLFFRPLTE